MTGITVAGGSARRAFADDLTAGTPFPVAEPSRTPAAPSGPGRPPLLVQPEADRTGRAEPQGNGNGACTAPLDGRSANRLFLGQPAASAAAATGPASRPANRPTAAPTMVCCGGILHEHTDFCQLVAEITDRRGPRYVTPLGDSRERPVRCRHCADPDVWALDAICDRCSIRQAERTAA